MKRKLLSIIVALAMCLALMPMSSFATSETVATLTKSGNPEPIGEYHTIKAAVEAYNSRETGDYVIDINGGNYTTDYLIVSQKAVPKHLTIRPKNNNETVTLSPSCKDGCYFIFLMDGQSEEITDNSLTIDNIQFDLSKIESSSDCAVLYFGSGGSGTNDTYWPIKDDTPHRYAHNVTLSNCIAYGNNKENSYFVLTNSNCSASCLTIDGCEISNFGYVVNAYLDSATGYANSEEDKYSVRVKNTTASGIKCFINNQIGQNSKNYVDGCSINFYHDYCIRIKTGLIDVRNTTFTSTYNGLTTGGAIVMRDASGDKKIVVSNCVFNKSTEVMYDTHNDKGAETKVFLDDTQVATLSAINSYCYNFPIPVAQIQNDKYSTLEDSIENSKTGDTIKLLADIAESTFAIPQGVTLDANGKNLNTTNGWTLAQGSVTIADSIINGTDMSATATTGAVNGGIYAPSGTLDLRGVDLRLKGEPQLFRGSPDDPETLDTLKASRVLFGDIYDGGNNQTIKNIVLENCTTAYRAALGVYYDCLTVDNVSVNAAENWYWNQQYNPNNYQMYTGFGGTLNINKSLTTGEYMNAGYSVGGTGITNLADGAVINCVDFQNTGNMSGSNPVADYEAAQNIADGKVHVNGSGATLNAAAINNHAITNFGTINLTAHSRLTTQSEGVFSVNYGTGAAMTIGTLNFKNLQGDTTKNQFRIGDNAKTIIGGLTSSSTGADFYVTGESDNSVNKNGGNAVQFTGDIVFTKYSNSDISNTKFSLNLDSSDDYFTGSVRGTKSVSARWGKWGSGLNGDETAYNAGVSGMTINMSNGSKWNMTNDSIVNELTVSGSKISGGALTVTDSASIDFTSQISVTGITIGGILTVNMTGADTKKTYTLIDDIDGGDNSYETVNVVGAGWTAKADSNGDLIAYYTAPELTMADYAYGTTPSTPSKPAIDNTTATVYYSSKTFLDSSNSGTEWKDITSTTLKPGNYFMKVVYTSGSSIVSETPQVTFTVSKGSQSAPTAPTTNGPVVTVADADRTKTLEYAVDGTTNWITVPKLTDGTFTLGGLTAGNHTVYLRVRETSLYNASEPVSAGLTVTQYSVSYNLNYGVGTVPETQTQTAPATITVASGKDISRKGYTFAGWNTSADGTGTSYSAGSTIASGATLYAKWVANDYTVKFDKNGGEGSVTDQDFTYDAKQTLTANTFEKTGYTFAGWATSANGKVAYLDKQSVKNLAESGSITFYAVWTQNISTVTGHITSVSSAPITVELKQGATSIQKKEGISPSGSPYAIDVTFENVPYGTYNLVITQGNVVVTQIIVNSSSTDIGKINMPDSNVNSVLEVKEDTPAVVVGNLDKEAASKAEEDKNVFVVMTVEKQEEQDLPETATAKEQDTQEAIAAIEEKAEEVTQSITTDEVQVEFLNITVEKYVGATTMTLSTLNTATTTETVIETNNVIEVVVPYDMSGKENITVYRYHDNKAIAFEKLNAKPTASYTDGTYYLDTTNNLIYIYTKKFSTYGISYTESSTTPVTPSPGPSGSTGGTVTKYIISGADTTNGKLTVSNQNAAAGQIVTITVTPDKGYTLETLTVKDASGKEVALTATKIGETYTFKMPASNVTVKATFMEDNTMLNFFVDVFATDYYYDAVLWAANNGITSGVDATHFAPMNITTRAQMVTFMWRAAGCPEPTTTTCAFTDVVAGSYYEKAVLWGVENGYVKGTSLTTFSPDLTVTRGQAVAFLARMAGIKDEDTGYTHGFNDVALKDYYNNAVAWASTNKITDGISKNSFAPKDGCKRGQIVTFLYRFFVK